MLKDSRTSYYRLNDVVFNFVKPRRDNEEKRLKCTENIAFNYNPPLSPHPLEIRVKC